MSTDFEVLRIFDLYDAKVWNENQFFRLKSDHHARYLSVDLSSIDLDANQNWPRIIDEALRSLVPARDCTLTINSFGNGWFSRDELMQRIYQFCAGKVSLLSVKEDVDKFISTLQVKTESRHIHLDNLSIGIVTDGANDEKLARILNSISALKATSKLEIETLVSGPAGYNIPNGLISAIDRYIPTEEPSQLPAMITIKKNTIAAECRFENLILCHDRFVFDESLSETLQDFGGDFDVCAIQVCDQHGFQIPNWTSFNNDWQNGLALDPDNYDENIFYQGSLFLVKKSVMLQHPLNPLLYWGFGEDIEWSRRLNNSGITPKLVSGTGVTSIGHRDGYFTWFLPVPSNANRKYVPNEIESRKSTVGFAPLGTKIKVERLLSKESSSDLGLIFRDTASFSKHELSLDANSGSIDFAIYFEFLPAGGLELLFGLSDIVHQNQISKIQINDYVCLPSDHSFQEKKLKILFDKDRLEYAGPSAVRVKIFLKSTNKLGITFFSFRKIGVNALIVKANLDPTDFSGFLTSGWYESSQFGVWTRGKVSEMVVPINPKVANLTITIRGILFKNSWGMQSLQVLNYGVEKFFKTISEDDSESIEISIKDLKSDESGLVNLKFVVGDPVSPRNLGLSNDDRRLGFELRNLEIN